MPIYEYRCTVCGHIAERYVASDEDRTDQADVVKNGVLGDCSHCGLGILKPVLSVGAFRMTGFEKD